MNGLDVLLARDRFPRNGARVGLLAHAASLALDGDHAAEKIARCGAWRLARLFSPEHGFFGRGAAGQRMASSLHPALQIPIHSLYGAHRAPPPQWLENLDLLVTDLQDLGVRCYTYASTLQNVLRACARAGVAVLVLDRPTPLEGIVDGPALDPAFRSFVGQIDLPLVYGLSQGPLARHLARTDPALAGLALDVVDATPAAATLPWRPPSPAIGSRDAARLYPLTVWCEAIPGVTVERGGPRSFQVWGMDGLDAERLAGSLELPGCQTRAGTAGDPSVPALLFEVVGRKQWRPVTAAVRLLAALRDQFGAGRLFHAPGARPEFFDKLMGTDRIRKGLEAGLSPVDLEALCRARPAVGPP